MQGTKLIVTCFLCLSFWKLLPGRYSTTITTKPMECHKPRVGTWWTRMQKKYLQLSKLFCDASKQQFCTAHQTFSFACFLCLLLLPHLHMMAWRQVRDWCVRKKSILFCQAGCWLARWQGFTSTKRRDISIKVYRIRWNYIRLPEAITACWWPPESWIFF